MPNQEVRLSLSRLLRPIWVDLTAAACTALALRQSAAGRRLLLNTKDQDVAAEYIDRAVYSAGGTVQIRSTDVFGEDPDELFDELEKQVIERCRPIRKNPSSENLAAWLEEDPHSRPVLFLRPRSRCRSSERSSTGSRRGFAYALSAFRTHRPRGRVLVRRV
jgi:hypothetical protein